MNKKLQISSETVAHILAMTRLCGGPLEVIHNLLSVEVFGPAPGAGREVGAPIAAYPHYNLTVESRGDVDIDNYVFQELKDLSLDKEFKESKEDICAVLTECDRH